MVHPTNLAASFGVNSLGVEVKILHFQSSSMTKCPYSSEEYSPSLQGSHGSWHYRRREKIEFKCSARFSLSPHPLHHFYSVLELSL